MRREEAKYKRREKFRKKRAEEQVKPREILKDKRRESELDRNFEKRRGEVQVQVKREILEDKGIRASGTERNLE